MTTPTNSAPTREQVQEAFNTRFGKESTHSPLHIFIFEQGYNAARADLSARIAELEEENAGLVSAIDEHMLASHIGVFNRGDDPKEALNKIACYEQDVGGYFKTEELRQQLSACQEESAELTKQAVNLFEQLAAEQLRNERLREALEQCPAVFHAAINGKPCTCGMCEFLRKKEDALSAIKEK